MPIVYKKGDLFEICEQTDYRDFALAHCISEDCVMGKGIAVEFKKRFGSVPALKRQVAEGKRTGSAAELRKGRRIYYLITKKIWRNKPTYDSIEKSLQEMCLSMTASAIPGVLMPKIGCGLDRLEWPKVEEIIRRTIGAADISVVVCSL